MTLKLQKAGEEQQIRGGFNAHPPDERRLLEPVFRVCQTSSELLGKAALSEPILALDFHFPVLADFTFLLPFHALPFSPFFLPSFLLPYSPPISASVLSWESYYVAQAGLGLIISLLQLSEYRDGGSIVTD